MSRRFWRRRTVLITGLIVALSLGIVFASIPYLPSSTPRHGTITQHSVPLKLNGGSQAVPGHSVFKLPGVSNNESFWVGVNVASVASGTTATFCVLADPTWMAWVGQSDYSWANFPRSSCVFGPEAISSGILTFLPPYLGTWDIAAFNFAPSNVTVTFTPA